ncbi:hypothetical protein A3A76_03645 [Candidatus Woesebacteria bacterium RIFCSPLOWO2_01_FULL_39_23]|uniref:Glycosyltransferase 2-like domain-containing protein n=1 Tax=Candidatus Woesebacteria bacterium RIFCSPHIGHO2_01_FULL_40_22 TaxID=1802499 RepID=A0A1F7YLS2_9BACT|nr:MAG: hypothetical protein A2141_00380 [Candidatus Woesebacteria bacterium RBG_16_40_11]OGM27548.1 MAG: hypothetical protein A2628_02045 [Candidatus Woesebacteria bacterium RIFCSPHIGHO2_01_FULL_40_22]OGM36140.1 MAG: hypothetical protein A3E41_02285 [Candidatus Woesebacteria bacterium RIFCSPHIGHO2_12_FULL_38_9]OGM62722.1 MAG: hypothetical protein A3A76_03645 [Candidatus Woesebacteria bacterium RIFCSPLOWO2_01_FULL_39_23]
MTEIWAHTLVKNEENYIWYAIKSIIDFVDKILVWDTGSSDKTVEIIQSLKGEYGSKIDFKECGNVDIDGYTKLRQEMLNITSADWFIILDGDEVWWRDSIKELTEIIRVRYKTLDSVFTRNYNLIGDIYHYQDDAFGKYEIDEIRGHLSVKAINRHIPGLYTSKPHGQHGYFDKQNILVQDMHPKRRLFLDRKSFLHFTHLKRSGGKSDEKVPKRPMKYKYELSNNFPLDFYYPEAFFLKRPNNIRSPWIEMDIPYKVRAFIDTPLRKVKRRMIYGGTGY